MWKIKGPKHTLEIIVALKVSLIIIKANLSIRTSISVTVRMSLTRSNTITTREAECRSKVTTINSLKKPKACPSSPSGEGSRPLDGLDPSRTATTGKRTAALSAMARSSRRCLPTSSPKRSECTKNPQTRLKKLNQRKRLSNYYRIRFKHRNRNL